MSFIPVNPEVYASAQAGAMAGMAGAGVLTDPSSPDYALLGASAAAFGQEMDTVWAVTPGRVLTGTVSVVNGSDVVTFLDAQSLPAGEEVVFGNQPLVAYTIAANTSNSFTAVLTAVGGFSGVTNAATTATTVGPPLDEYGCKVITMASFQLWASRVPSPIAAPQWAIPATYLSECLAIAGMVQEGTAVNVANGTVLPACPAVPSFNPTPFAMFFGNAPGDYAATIAVGANIDFPHAGPTSDGTTITRTGAGTFQLGPVGSYQVSFQVGVTEAGQFELTLGGALVPSAVASRATGTSQLVMQAIVTTTVPNEILTVQNPPGNATALTVTPASGSLTHAPSANLCVVRLA